jgi:hypothetical protein
MNPLTILTQILSKTGMDKGDASTASGLGLGGLGIVFMLFVSKASYEAGVKAQDNQNTMLWHQVHEIQNTLNQRGIYVPTVSATWTNTDKETE